MIWPGPRALLERRPARRRDPTCLRTVAPCGPDDRLRSPRRPRREGTASARPHSCRSTQHQPCRAGRSPPATPAERHSRRCSCGERIRPEVATSGRVQRNRHMHIAVGVHTAGDVTLWGCHHDRGAFGSSTGTARADVRNGRDSHESGSTGSYEVTKPADHPGSVVVRHEGPTIR